MTPTEKYETIEYLKLGNPIQNKLFNDIKETNLFNFLSPFSPKLVGTFPIELNIIESDADIIIDTSNLKYPIDFENYFKNVKNLILNFEIKENSIYNTLIQFNTRNFNYEIFGIAQDTNIQYAFVNMIIEEKILNLLGKEFRNEIINLKNNGFKTEPAFAKALNISADPYKYLYELNKLSNFEFEEKIKKLFKEAHFV